MQHRKKSHEKDAEKGSALYFHRALAKYGFDVFEWFVIVDNISGCNLNTAEIMVIRMFQSQFPHGYNLTAGGEGCTGMRVSAESKKRMSDSAIGKPKSEETKEKIRSANLGRKHTPETCAKMSASRKGKPQGPLSEETKEKIRQANLGKKASEETKAKLRARPGHMKGKKHTPETVQKMRENCGLPKGSYKHSDEVRSRMSDAAKTRMQTETGRSQIAAAAKKGTANSGPWTDEQKARHSERIRQMWAERKLSSLSNELLTQGVSQ